MLELGTQERIKAMDDVIKGHDLLKGMQILDELRKMENPTKKDFEDLVILFLMGSQEVMING